MTVHTYDTDLNNIVDDADTVAIVNARVDDHELDYDHTAIEHTNREALNSIIAEPTTLIKYVDNGRIDTYTPDGSEMKPFKTVQLAIDSIIDASNSKKYTVYVKNGSYTEDLNIKPYVNLKGESKESVKITGTHSCVFSTGGRLEIKDLTLRGTLTFDKPTGTVNGVAVWLDNAGLPDMVCNFKGAVDYFHIINNCMTENITHHSSHFVIRDSLIQGDLITDDQDLEYPDPTYGDSGTRNLSNCGCANVTCRGNSWLEIHNSHIWGVLTSDGADCYLNYDVTSAPENSANIISVNAGNINRMSYASSLSNDSLVTGITVKDALNNILSDVESLNSGLVNGINSKNGVSGSFTTVDGKTITVVDGQITSIV